MKMASKILGQLAIWRIDSKNLIQAWPLQQSASLEAILYEAF